MIMDDNKGIDNNRRKCKNCNSIVTRISNGKFDERQKKFTDENGVLWNGKICPKCNQIRLKQHMKGVRKVLKGLC
jgi:uncharacterized protein with PIN domain